MEKMNKISARIHLAPKDALFTTIIMVHAPRVGEEIRLRDKSYAVLNVIWCYDEPNSPYERVNLRVALISEGLPT